MEHAETALKGVTAHTVPVPIASWEQVPLRPYRALAEPFKAA